jgi:hypothetical protein
MKKIVSVLTICLTLLAFSGLLYAQGDKVQFGAYSRALQQTNRLGNSDTLHADNLSEGHLLVDLGIHVNPDKNTQVSTILRLKSNLGGFYGSGNTANIRQIYVRGILGNFLNYHVGDIFLKMTPYTMFNSNAELAVNEASVFRDLRNDYVYYDNLNKGNSWWQQGAHTNFAIGVKSKFLQAIKIDGFMLRNRMAVGAQPTRFHAGGRVMLVQSSRFYLGGNYLNLYDLGASVGPRKSVVSVRNPVYTAETEVIAVDNNKFALQLNAEVGFSQLNFVNDTAAPKTLNGNIAKLNGSFVDASVTGKVKPAHLKVKVGYSYTSPRFYSSAAQTKRIDYTKTPYQFPAYGNDPFNPVNRNIGAYDIVRDPTIYNQKITPILMAYNPAYGNATPYGKATPNRMGVNMEVNYKDSLERINIDLSGAYLTEVVGTDSYTSKRNFLVASVSADLYLNKFINFQKKILIHGGVKMENTTRPSDSTFLNVNLQTQIYDGGVEIEILKKLDLLFGVKSVNAKGSENYAIRNTYNEITGFNVSYYRNMNFQQVMLGYGLKYRFSKQSYLTTQYHTFAINDATNSAKTINFNQFYILFIMNF